MSSGIINPYVDFKGTDDSGKNIDASIHPATDGEAVTSVVIGRGGENLRLRTETLRGTAVDSLYLQNADRALIISGPGRITWPGSTTAAASGILVVTDNLYILPMLTPGFAQTPPVPPVASAFGVIHLKRASDSMNSILVTSSRRSYSAGDQINITVVAGGSFSCTLDAETAGLRRTISIVATGATTLGTTITALNAIIPSAPDNTQLVVAALEGGAASGDLLLTTQARQFMVGNYDGESHTITPANLASFFSANPTQVLAEGDTLCVAYAMLYDTASNGGRRQSIPENSNTTVTAGMFFNSRLHPEKLVNALPICKVVNGRLVFTTGAEVPAGVTSFDLTEVAASSVAYAGGAAWADGTTNPAATVEAQLDKIIVDLGGTGGASKIKYDGGGTWADGTTNPAATVEAQLDKVIADLAGAAGSSKIQGVVSGADIAAATLTVQIADLAVNWLKLSRANTIAGAQTFSALLTSAAITASGLITANAGVTAGINQHVTVSGTGAYKRGTRVRHIPGSAGVLANGDFTADHINGSYFQFVGVGDLAMYNIIVDEGEMIQDVTAFVSSHIAGAVDMRVFKTTNTAGSAPNSNNIQLGTVQHSVGLLSNIEAMIVTGLTETVPATLGTHYVVNFDCNDINAQAPRVYGVFVTTTIP